jgi:long-chain alkane monooxygenase
MSAARTIHLNAFDMSCVGHQSPGLWRHPDDQSFRYTDLDYWTGLAALLERGCFDSLFIADVLGVYDVYQGGADAAVTGAAQVPVNDPMLAVSAMAAVTRHLGFGITVSSTYEQPYALARKFGTLDHLSKGRVGWNIVTSYLDSAARNLGLATQVPHDERYQAAEEFLEVCYDPDQPLRYVRTEAVRSAVEGFTTADPNREWTPREIARFVGIGGRGPVVAGGPRTVADEMERWLGEADVD